MMWARPTCTSLADYAGSFLLVSMLYGVEGPQHLALTHAIVASPFFRVLRACPRGAVCNLLCAKPDTTLSRDSFGHWIF